MEKRYSVLIVDDEKPARELVKNIIDWEKYGFWICGEAKNGQEGYRLYQEHQPDLIITDIDMPVLDGLEFIRKVRTTDAKQKFIILSCYEEFAFAKEAIRLNVNEYMIKDLLTEEEIIVQLSEFYDQNTPNLDLRMAKRDYPDWEGTSRKLKQLVVNDAYEEIYYSLEMETQHVYGILVVSIDDYRRYQLFEPELDKGRIKNRVLRTLLQAKTEHSNILEFAHIGNGRFIVIIRLGSSISESHQFYELNQLANSIRYIHMTHQEESLTIAIGRTFNQPQDLVVSFQSAMEAITYRMYLGKAKNISYNSGIIKCVNVSGLNAQKLIQALEKHINSRQKDEAEKIIVTLFSDKNSGFIQYHYLAEVNEQLVMILIDVAKRYEISQQKLWDESISPLHNLESMDTIKEMKEWFLEVIQVLITLLNEKENYSRHVLIAKQYIEEHMCEAVSLSNISEHLHLHKVYLARIFKKEMGMTITQYIHVVRIEEAKKLIRTTNLKLYEIAEKIGYANTHYFFVVFKKICGITANGYREKYKIVNIEQ